jgi:branched-chain amino acid transport system permease protein
MDWGAIFSDSLRAAIGTQAIIYALAAVGLNLHFGYTGLLNFGQVGFVAIGAYGVAIGVLEFDLPLLLAVALGIAMAVVLALLLGVPTLRLRADYLAIVTIAAGEILRLSIKAPSWREFTGGSDGLGGYNNAFYDINPIPDGSYGFGPWRYGANGLWSLLVGWTLVVVATLFVRQLIFSPWGRTLKAIREDEDAVRALGKNVYGHKMQSLIVGGVIGAFGGMFWALSGGSVVPDNFVPIVTFFAYAALILGGAARTWGPVVGSVILWTLLDLTQGITRSAQSEGYIPESLMTPNQVGNVPFVVAGILLFCLMIFRPQGIFGDRNEIALQDR